MKHKLLLLYIFFFFLPFVSLATHIVGGSLTYEQLGGSTYRVTLKLYRDCKPGSAAFPSPVSIAVYKNCGGTNVMNISIPFPGATSVPPNIDTCAVNPGICLEEAVYTKVVSGLPPTAGGYDLFYSYCCRNSTLSNIVSPLTTGETWYAHIPDNGVVIFDSSPKWVNPPPVFVCQGNNMSVDHSATDADGDSLVYSLYTPYSDVPAPSWPGCVFTPTLVTWSSTYGPNNPLDPVTPGSLTITPNGILHGVPPSIGQFVAGVRCEEYRDGVKIGEILRDFQFNVVNCPPVATASFNSSGACNGTAITFTNTTTPSATTYYWNFGDGSTLADTSHAINTSYTYPSLGIYTAMLIINKGTPCADTSIQTVNLSFVNADFSDDAPACKGVPIHFTDTSSVDPSSSITGWNWNFGDGNTATVQNPAHPYGAGGTFSVTLVVTSAAGCKDTVVHTVTIQGMPIANAGNDTVSCTNNSSINLGGTVLNAGGGQWIGGPGDIFNPPGGPTTSTLNPTLTPSAAAVANGADTLTLFTTSNALCPADTDQIIISFYPGPTVNAGPDIFVCKDTTYIDVCGTVTVASGAAWSSNGTGVFTALGPPNCERYHPTAADATAGSIMFFLTSTGNGNCIAAVDTTVVTFTATPVSVITSNDTSCANNPLVLNATTTNGTGIWTSSGTGTFSPSDTTLNGVYNPSPTDDTNGNVTLIFTSTHNGGCRSNADTITVQLIPSPTAAYSSVDACPLQNVIFTDASTSSGSIVSWNWNFGDGSATSSLQNPTHPYNAGGPYNVSLIVTSNNGCVDTLTQVLNVYNKPLADFNANGICLNDGTLFMDSSTVGGSTISSWSWTFGDASTGSTIQSPTHFYATSGSYNATLIVQSAQGCIDTVTQTVSVLPGPAANFASDDYTANQNQNVHFTDQSTNGAISWFWNFGDGSSDSTSTLQNPSHIYTKGGFFNVCEYVTDINGCTDTLCKQEIISLPPTVPSGFSPNGDGQNDIFFVYGGPFKSLEFKIYNNWGELIFESTDQATGWDGKRKGIDQPVGVYVYTVDGTTEDGETHKLSGDVTLLR